jgi:hypothetical protein
MGQLCEPSLLAKVQHEGLEFAFLRRIKLWSSVRGEQFIHADLGASEGVK